MRVSAFYVRKSGDLICKRLIAEGIIVRSGTVWGCDTYIGVTIGIKEQNQQLINALQKVLIN